MHDRRLNGQELTLGNQGALFMNAMTWWDHETGSIWSQPWGAAIAGPLRGSSLTLLPAQVVPWRTWFEEHPDTRVLVDEHGAKYGSQAVLEGFVIGVSIQDSAVGYYYRSAAAERVVNDSVGEFPVVVFVEPASMRIGVYLRSGLGTPADEAADVPDVLTFEVDNDGTARDVETGSIWDVNRGIAVDGPLRGAALQQVPYVTAFDWAWEDFFPHTEFRGDASGRGRGPRRPR